MTDTKTIDDLYLDAAKASTATVTTPAAQAAATASSITPEAPATPTTDTASTSLRQRRLWSDEQKREHLAAIAKIKAEGGPRSGGIRDYCEKNGLAQSLVSLWRRTLVSSNGGASKVRATAARASRKPGRKAATAKRTAAQERLTTARAIVSILSKALKAMD
jgi:transposase-like protein